MAVTLSECSSRLLCCKIFVLKYFHRTSTLQKIFNAKILLTKISFNENFPIFPVRPSVHSLLLDVQLFMYSGSKEWRKDQLL